MIKLMEKCLELKSIVGNIYNFSHKNSARLRGLKEGVEDDNFITYLEDLFSTCLGADSNTVVQIVKVYHEGPLHKAMPVQKVLW